MRPPARRLHRTFKPVGFDRTLMLATTLTLRVNGTMSRVDDVDAARPLLWYLRDRLGLLGTKFGCGHGGCGACTVQVDGEAVASCGVTVGDVAGKAVVTIEGLAENPARPVLRAWLAEQVPQCGYCQPAMIVAAEALLGRTPAPTDADIDAALAHVLCRCGTYQRVRNAIHRAADGRWDDAPFPARPLPPPPAAPAGALQRLNPWVTIAADGTPVLTIERSEMGQGVNTALAMLIAEELDVPLESVRTRFAEVDAAYDNPVIGMQITVGSMSVRNGWLRLRRAGADARARLMAAAALRWGVTTDDCRTCAGTVHHDGSGRTAGYGELPAEAAALPPLESPPLRDREQFTILGRPTARLEIPDHMAGRTVFGMDVRLPGMLYATMLFPPAFASRALHVDASAAKEIAGVRHVFAVAGGVAVVADDLWTAMRGREAVAVTWSEGKTELSSPDIHARLLAALERRGTIERNVGDAQRALTAAPAVVEAVYDTPYVAHAPIEPINATVRIAGGRCEVWVPTQGQTMARAAAARAAGLPIAAVEVHTTFIGGGFGRRSVPDFVSEAVRIAKRVAAPVQLVWTRADDLQHDRFRPTGATRLRAALDDGGKPSALSLRIAGPKLAFEGITIPYAIPSIRVECVEDDPGVPTGYWRSVGSSQNAFAIEGFIDELAHAAGADPVDFRLRLLESSPRHRAVLERAAAEAGWGRPLDGRARGAAVYYAHGGWAAQIAEVSVDANGRIRVHRVVCAVDCGFAVNPDTLAAQIEGGIAFGLTAALKSKITLDHGRVEQTGFRDYPLLTIAEMPLVEVHVVASGEDPTGAGECGVPPIAPAVANAVFAATGRRLRSLPLRL
jgi:isoquinoline 1-oxidoreductase beta subunit